MQFQPPLITGTLIKRYKRFLADIELDDGSLITAHCPNTGSMKACSTPGSRVGLSISDNPKRKYAHTLEIVEDNNSWVGVNTSRTNHLAAEAIRENQIAEFTHVTSLKKEVKVSAKSRLDIVIEKDDQSTFIEIKNCSLAVDNQAMFPDAVTERGTKHLHELMELIKQGYKGCIFYLIQRMDAEKFKPAAHIDPVYSNTLKEAADKGVMVLAYQAEVSPAGIEVIRSLPVEL